MSGLDGRDLPRSGEPAWGLGADEADTKVSFEEVEVRRESSSGIGSSATLCTGDGGYCLDFPGGDVWPSGTASCAVISFNNIFWGTGRFGLGERITVLARLIDFGGGVEARGFPLASRDTGCADSWVLFFALAGGGAGGRAFASARASSGFSCDGLVTVDDGDAEFLRTGELASFDGDSSFLAIGLIVLGGLGARGFDFSPNDFRVSSAATPFFTGSVSSFLFSNIDIKAFVDGIEVVSVAKSRLLTELAVLSATLCFRCLPTCCGEYGRDWAAWLRAGLTDLLAARVAAMKDGERGSGIVGLLAGPRWEEVPRFRCAGCKCCVDG